MAHVATTGIDLAYETLGDPSAVPVLLVMGLGTQLIAWPDELCADLTGRGLFLVRFDNRDVGLSTHLESAAAPGTIAAFLGLAKPPYTIDDMARDTLGLLDALELPSAHIVGVSMGGFIAQSVALLAPARVRSLTLIMTSTGSRRVGHPRPKVAWRGLRPRPAPSAEAAIDAVVESFRRIGSPGFPFDEERLRDLARRSLERSDDAAGVFRQLAAVLAQPDRTRRLGALDVPTTVIHGLADPLVGVSGGRALARAIPGARLVVVPGMGHDLPLQVLPRIADEIGAVVRLGESRPYG